MVWCSGGLVVRWSSAVVRWSGGPVVRWSSGTVVLRGMVVQLYGGTVVRWYSITAVGPRSAGQYTLGQANKDLRLF